MTSLEIFGVLSGVFITISFIPYFVSLWKREAKPERMSWFIWSVLGGISFFTQLAKGAKQSLWLPGIQAIGDVLVFIVSIKYGMGGVARRDKVAMFIAILGLVLWYITNEPTVALVIAIIVDGAGAVLTVIKSYEHPSSEPIAAWILTGLGGFFAIFAVGSLNWVLLIFPVYIFLANVAIVSAILIGRQRSKIVA